MRTGGGGTRHIGVFHRLFPNLPAYPVDLVTTETRRDRSRISERRAAETSSSNELVCGCEHK